MASEHDLQVQRMILATATALALAPPSSVNVRAVLMARIAVAAGETYDLANSPLGPVVAAAMRVAIPSGSDTAPRDPEAALRAVLMSYFALQSDQLAQRAGLVPA